MNHPRQNLIYLKQVLYFLIQPDDMCFSAQDPIINILQRRCGDRLVTKVWKLAKFDLKTERLYWIWSSHSHTRKKSSFRNSYSLK